MTKEVKRTMILTCIVCLIPIVVGLFLYPSLPETVVTHWNAAGEPDGWSSRAVAVFVLPGAILLLNLLFPFLLKMDPKYNNISDKIKCLVQWSIPLIGLFCSGITLASALGVDMKIRLIAPMFMGVLFIILGNFMPKMAQSYTVGIRLPWTLDDEDNWNRTHHFAGFLWVICGLLMIAGAFLSCRVVIFSVLVGMMVLLPILYSFILFVKKKKESSQ